MSSSEHDADAAAPQMIPIEVGEKEALQLYAPHLSHVTEVKFITERRSKIVSVLDQVVIKRTSVALSEAENMRFVREHTSVRLPRLYGTYEAGDGRSYLVMEHIFGDPVDVAWPMLSPEQKHGVAAQLKGYFDELRTLPSENYIGSLQRGPLICDMLRGPNAGPFASEADFNDALVKYFDFETNNNDFKYAKRDYHVVIIKGMLNDRHEIVFSHGDVGKRNIMIHEGQVSAIIDWEYAGFYPEYWEYAIAFSDLSWKQPSLADWTVCLQHALKPYPVEAATIDIMETYSLCGH